MNSNILRVGLIGCGAHSTEIIIPTLRSIPNIKVLAVCDSQVSAATEASLLLGGIPVARDLGELIRHHDLNAIIAVGPPQMHAVAALKALERGLHVFVEKPPAITAKELSHLAETAASKKLVTCVGHNLRHSDAAQQLRRVLNGDEQVTLAPPIGKPVAMEMRYFASKPRGDRWGLGSALRSFLLSHVNHAIDFMIFQMGSIARVSAAIASTKTDGIALSAHFVFTSGAVGTLFATSSAPRFSFAGTIVTDAHKVVRFDALRQLEVEAGDGVKSDKAWRTTWTSKTLEFGYDHAGYGTEISLFANAAIEQRPDKCHPSFGDELAVYDAIDEIERMVLKQSTR
ncbi:Gfo/Idh/MocA family protein [Oleiharenicola lentus]|uniref:Gfo/Idh/MocA family protein n=1 Tax=Oleiharenicola lentus TaxID=2508720 RepID=UPI003F678658